MKPAALAAFTAAAAVAGLLLLVVGLVGTRRAAGPPSRTANRVNALFGVGLSTVERRRRQAVLILTVAATAGVWLATGWPVAGLLVGVAVPGVPWLLTAGRAETRMINRLDAVESWTRRLRDLVSSGYGLISAIGVSAGESAGGIREEVSLLAADLLAGADPTDALTRFADSLADLKSDEVVAALMLHVGNRGQRLSEVLGSQAGKAGRAVVMRRGVAAKRAEPRFVTYFMVALIAVVVVLLLADVSYSRPYGQLLGQMVLLSVGLLIVGLLVWIRRLTQPVRYGRFLPPAVPAPASRPDSVEVPAAIRAGAR